MKKWAQVEDQGARACEELREGVEQAIRALGAGFLRAKGNTGLRQRLRTGKLSDYYRQLLCLVYRLLMLLVAEDKQTESGGNLLHPPAAPAAPRQRYARYYSVGRIRDCAFQRRRAPGGDLYESLKKLFKKLRTGDPRLGIPGLGSFLFSPAATPDLDAASLANQDLLEAFRHLCHTKDFGEFGSEELGVYQSLLELHPRLGTGEGSFTLGTAAGHQRKTTGSYYTPRPLINCLLDSALDPVVKSVLNRSEPAAAEAALLNLKVCDPACGSGHFLIAAAERLALHLARLRTGDDQPAALAVQQAKRQVIHRCIYGVDVNPMAVELCKVSLWLEALDPGQPLSFLDHHIQCGNSLLGTTPKLLAGGLPDEAFTASEGDDRAVVAQLKKNNRREREDDRDTRHQAELVRGTANENARLLADAWCAVFLWKKNRTKLGRRCPTAGDLRTFEANPDTLPREIRAEIPRLQGQYQFFHWHLAFPGVFRLPGRGEEAQNALCGWIGGFDVVLGNPPYSAAIEKRARSLINFKYEAAQAVANSAADFLASGRDLLSSDGLLGFVVPKSFTYSYDWRRLRDDLLPFIHTVIDVSQAWKEVLLEQILIGLGRGNAAQAKVGTLNGQRVPIVATLRPAAANALGIIPTGLDRQDHRLLDVLLQRTGNTLGKYCTTLRGTGLQRFARESGPVPIMGGKNITSFGVRAVDRYLNPPSDRLDETALRRISPPQAVFQNIVAHIQNPQPHIRLIGTVCQQPYACLDTVNLLTPSDFQVSPYFLAGLLMSDLINWFVYVCIYNRAVRTMHFDGYFLEKIPAPPESTFQAIHAAALRVSESPDEAERWRELNQAVYDAYCVSSEQASRIAAMHKARHL